MTARRLRAGVVAGALAVTIAAFSRLPYTPPAADAAVLRLSWRMSIAAKENCRQRTQEELDALPVHMRTPEVCTPDASSYFLVTRIGDAPPDTLPIVRGGVKGDRPVFVLEERRLPPGRRRIVVRLERAVPEGERERILELDTALVFAPGMVQLVTLGPDGRSLVTRSSTIR